MGNFRVADLDGLLAQLRAGGVTVDEKVERSEYGGLDYSSGGVEAKAPFHYTDGTVPFR